MSRAGQMLSSRSGFPCRFDVNCSSIGRTREEIVTHEAEQHGYFHVAARTPSADGFNAMPPTSAKAAIAAGRAEMADIIHFARREVVEASS